LNSSLIENNNTLRQLKDKDSKSKMTIKPKKNKLATSEQIDIVNKINKEFNPLHIDNPAQN